MKLALWEKAFFWAIGLVCAALIVLCAVMLIWGEDNPCTKIHTTGKTSWTENLTGELRGSQGYVLRCKDGERL